MRLSERPTGVEDMALAAAAACWCRWTLAGRMKLWEEVRRN